MVSFLRIFLICFCGGGALYSLEDIKVEVLLDQTTFSVSQPVLGSVVITRPSAALVDPKSFVYEGKPLAVEFLRKIDFPGNDPLALDTYRFKIDPFAVGLHVISPISVKINGQKYASIPISFEVKALSKMPASRPQNVVTTPLVKDQKEDKPFLKLDKIFREDGPLYPGQKVLVGYRYSFKGDIELREEVIPLLDLDTFKKLGEKNIEDRQEGQVSIRTITQRVEVLTPGQFKIPESYIDGYAYKDKGWGPKTYFEPILKSQVPAFNVEVKPFPATGKPPFFNGAIGPFELSATLKAPPVIEKGDKFVLNLFIKGTGVPSTLKPINLMCQPGWAGFFRAGDLPPQEKSKKEETSFSYELRPLNRLTTQVPPIWLAYFDPQSATYKTIKTEPFPIKVSLPSVAPLVDKPPVKALVMEPLLEIPQNQKLTEYAGGYGRPLPFGTSSALLLIPAALLFAWLRLFYREREEALLLRKPSVEVQLLDLKRSSRDVENFAENASRLIEENWKPSERNEEVKSYLQKLEAALWGGVPVKDNQELYRELERLCIASGKLK